MNNEKEILQQFLKETVYGYQYNETGFNDILNAQNRKMIKAPIEKIVKSETLNNLLENKYWDFQNKYFFDRKLDFKYIFKPHIYKFLHLSKEEYDWNKNRQLQKLYNYLTQSVTLRENRIFMPNIKVFQINEIEYINNGEKFTSVAKKVFLKEYYDSFISEYLKIRNQAKGKAETLVISNRAVDFFTMSDNTYNWSSCMNWSDGDYRAGTLEVADSPHYLVAYIKGDKELYKGIDDKKWRQLVYVSQDAIIPIKGYPYESIEMEKIIVETIAETLNLDYKIEKFCFSNASFSVINESYMYNDIEHNLDTEHYCGFSHSFIQNPHNLYSEGKSKCLICGGDVLGESFLLCGECLNYVKCEHCGYWEPREDVYTTADGHSLCEYCWRETTECSICHENYYKSANIETQFDEKNKKYYNICIECKKERN